MVDLVEKDRVYFCDKFYALAKKKNISVLKNEITEREAVVWESAIAHWENDVMNRSITLDKSDDDLLEFDGFIKNMEENNEHKNLYLSLYKPQKHIEDILFLYDIWMNQNCDQELIESELQKKR